jgi:N4-(beta-N-acetylglucosaminyl)-L-asparaginase
MNRRNFITQSALGIGSLSALDAACTPKNALAQKTSALTQPLIISTWRFGLEANEAGMKIMQAGGTSLDAIEAAGHVPEADPNNMSVGYGGSPDRDGNVTLDACIMDWNGNAGSVCFLEHIMHPISVARLVMEKTPHVMLVGEGALQFALNNGFKKQNLLTEKAKAAWQKWLQSSEYKPVINIENHDTIGMLAIDKQGNISGGCTTSGMAYKMHGRVGDSPIIGAGLFVDNEVGGATSSGLGEAVLKTLGSFLVVELMRQGASPEEACKEAVMRIVRKQKNHKDFQVGFLAVNKAGDYGSYSIQQGFNYAVYKEGKNEAFDGKSYLK